MSRVVHSIAKGLWWGDKLVSDCGIEVNRTDVETGIFLFAQRCKNCARARKERKRR